MNEISSIRWRFEKVSPHKRAPFPFRRLFDHVGCTMSWNSSPFVPSDVRGMDPQFSSVGPTCRWILRMAIVSIVRYPLEDVLDHRPRNYWHSMTSLLEDAERTKGNGEISYCRTIICDRTYDARLRIFWHLVHLKTFRNERLFVLGSAVVSWHDRRRFLRTMLKCKWIWKKNSAVTIIIVTINSIATVTERGSPNVCR